MRIKSTTGSVTALLFSMVVCGCAGQVQYEQTAGGPLPVLPPICMGNNTATGAVGGAVLGALIGGLAGGRGGAALGAAIGGAGGLAAGAATDDQCRQIAAQRAMAIALAQQSAFLAQQASANQYGSIPVSPQSVEYVSSDNHHHKVRLTQLNSYADPATKLMCTAGSNADDDIDGKTSATVAAPKMCKGPDGKWAPAA